ncbi:MAG TPA: aminotransferase class I/II-fold pyridoxal phosphate-dependent enzyme [Anaerolineales bacterium]|nr:aminotransferase class I/II-fold pyridoxal phosphate-dependent enzyme [Anaerolineales bacterium]
MPSLPDFRLEAHFSKWEFKARHHLTASDMESVDVAELLSWADVDDREAWRTLRLGYTETYGAPALRRAIAATYETLTAEDVLCFAGAGEAIYVAMQVLLGHDDHAVVLVPNYQSFEELPLQLCAVTGVALHPEADWELDLDEVRAALRPNTRLIAVNFPNNPTGKVIAPETWRGLVALAEARGIYLLSDEVYRGLERDRDRALPQAADLYERGLSINVLSKAYGLPGLRIGWLATRDRALLGRLERFKHYTTICNSGPSEVLATIALKTRDRLLARNRALVAENLALLDGFFATRHDLFEWRAPEGGCVAYPRYLGADGVEAFCRAALEQAGVLLLPASIYTSRLLATPPDRFRIGYGRLAVPEGLAALAAFVDERPTA